MSNRIIKIEGLNTLSNLEQLYLADNGIETIENLDDNTALETLELANNRISILNGLEKLVKVDDFWFNGNKVSDWNEIEKLRCMTSLQTVYFEQNPIYKDSSYRTKMKLALPNLIQIDATPCR